MTQHKRVAICDGSVLVDEKLACIIQWLWDHDIATSNSCQDSLGMTWIQFETEEDEARLVDMTSHSSDMLAFIRGTLWRHVSDLGVSWRFPKEDLEWFEESVFVSLHQNDSRKRLQ
jgi:hypothetical protein